MFTLLRRIRRSLLESALFRYPVSPAGRYLVYAIGEILLVMIGILLALQVNNWNESRKNKKTEVRMLQNLCTTLKQDIIQARFFMDGNGLSIASCQHILSAFDNNLPYHDSLALHFEQANQWWKLSLSKHAYENAKTYGLDFIKSDSTRKKLSFLFDGQLMFAETLDEREALYYYNTVTPILTELFESIDHNWYIAESGNVPLDYEKLKRDQRYRNILKTYIGNRKNYNNWIEFTVFSMEQIDRELQMELEAY